MKSKKHITLSLSSLPSVCFFLQFGNYLSRMTSLQCHHRSHILSTTPLTKTVTNRGNNEQELPVWHHQRRTTAAVLSVN